MNRSFLLFPAFFYLLGAIYLMMWGDSIFNRIYILLTLILSSIHNVGAAIKGDGK